MAGASGSEIDCDNENSSEDQPVTSVVSRKNRNRNELSGAESKGLL